MFVDFETTHSCEFFLNASKVSPEGAMGVFGDIQVEEVTAKGREGRFRCSCTGNDIVKAGGEFNTAVDVG